MIYCIETTGTHGPPYKCYQHDVTTQWCGTKKPQNLLKTQFHLPDEYVACACNSGKNQNEQW